MFSRFSQVLTWLQFFRNAVLPTHLSRKWNWAKVCNVRYFFFGFKSFKQHGSDSEIQL